MLQLYPGDESTVGPDHPGPATDDAVITAVVAEDREPDGTRPWLFVNMVASIDGSTELNGTSGGLGGHGDRLVFRGLRASADYIIVGGGTVRAERYRPPQAYHEAAATRARRGQSERPRLAVVTGSLNLDPELPFLDDQPGPIVFHSDTVEASKASALAEVAELVPIRAEPGTGRLSPRVVVDELTRRGARRILSEGGPSINGQLVAAGLVDEWNLTLAPLVVGGDSPRAAVGPLGEGPPPGMNLRRVWTDEGYLFCRWTRSR